jgi:hypothetical protein
LVEFGVFPDSHFAGLGGYCGTDRESAMREAEEQLSGPNWSALLFWLGYVAAIAVLVAILVE